MSRKSPALAGLFFLAGTLALTVWAQAPAPAPAPAPAAASAPPAASAPAPASAPAAAGAPAPAPTPGASAAKPKPAAPAAGASTFTGSPTSPTPARRGEYIAAAGGCLGCHTEDRSGATPFAGGHALKTPFGTFYGPNLTPHPEAGLGRWSEADFLRAMRQGRRPDGAHYFPSFPYTSFTLANDSDLRDLWAYLRSLPPAARANQPHELGFLYRWRFLLWPWKWLFFSTGPIAPDAQASAPLNRGAYLARALGHCGECHTPRNLFGAVRKDRAFAGSKELKAPNLTPTRLKKYSDGELRDLLTTGMTADGDVFNDSMSAVVTNTTSKLTPDDLNAVIAYLRSLPPQPEEARK